MGVGLLYHLAHEGWTDTVLVEKDELASGSTWHAAGLVPHFIGSLNMAKVHAYGVELYNRLEEETGFHTGWHGCGAVRLATNSNEADWFKYVHGVLELVGVESHLVGPDEIRKLHPLVDTEGVVVGLHTPHDGWTDPSSSTNSLAAGARQLGAEIVRRNRVIDMNQLPDGRWETITEKGRIVSEHVVNAAGHFGPQLAAMVGLETPIVSVIHHYIVTEAIPEVAALDFEVPVLRDPRASCYYRQEHDGLLIGPYETEGSLSYGVGGIDWDLTFHLLPPDVEKLLPWLDLAAQRIPAFGEAGITRVVCGPITHTPDSGILMGPAPGLKNYWMCVGSSIGICQGPGVGKYLAQWMVHGQTEINVAEMDPRRFGPYAPGDFTLAKSIDEYHEMYQVRMPGEYREAGRPVKRTPLYDTLARKGAQFQEIYGWERARYFSPDGQPEEYSFRRSSAFGPVGEEVLGVRNGVGVADFDHIHQAGGDRTRRGGAVGPAGRQPPSPPGRRCALGSHAYLSGWHRGGGDHHVAGRRPFLPQLLDHGRTARPGLAPTPRRPRRAGDGHRCHQPAGHPGRDRTPIPGVAESAHRRRTHHR